MTILNKIKKNKESYSLLILIIIIFILILRSFYEKNNPVVLQGKKARIIAIASTGKDIHSPVSYLFGRAPYFIICDRLKGSYISVPNKYFDAQHAAGLRAATMIAGKKVDAVCGNNIGFEPSRVFHNKNIELYTNVKGSVWQTLQAFPESLTRIDKQTVPAHFGITGSKKNVPCQSFDAQSNLAEVVQGKYFVCLNCDYRISETKLSGIKPSVCPICGKKLHEIITVTAPLQGNGINPKVRIF